MKSRLSLAIVLLVMSVYSWAQILGMYAPAGSSAPDDPIQEYTLSLKATPTDGGSFNTTHVSMAGGKTYNLRAYPSTDFVFVAWLCNGDTLSKSSSYTYTMPYQDVEITGVFAYNPSSPSDPDVATPKYTLTLKATPSDGGSFNTTSTKVSVGERYNLRAYPKTDFAFVAWLCGGDTLSKSASYDYTMPSHNVDITGVFVYCPSNPSDPQDPVLKYQLSLTAVPMNSGSFNISNERLAVGSGHSLRAYANTDFVFKHWMAGDSVLSTSPSMDFVMPSHNVQLVGVFEYNPASPANPNRNHWNKQTGEVIVDDFTSGQLSGAISSAIGGSNSSDVQMMVVAGRITGNDFGIANNYTNCSLLDLSRVTGVTEVPSYAFDYTNLESVYLPATIEKIGRRAFADCSRLSALTVYAMTPPTLESEVFQGVSEGLVVYVPAASIAQYQDADGWKDFTLLPIQEDIRSISVSLPSGANAADYARMWLELTNTKSGQRMHYVMTDRTSYTFANIIRNTSWNVVLRNERGDVFGQIDKVEVKDEDVSVAFASLAKPQDVSLTVVTPDGKDVTEQTQVTWTDKVGNYLAQAYSLKGLLPETELAYRVTLSQELAMQYAAPASAEYMVSASGNEVKCRLEAIKQVQLTGKVKDVTTQSALGGATVSASQTFGGKYNKTVSTKTDANGNYTLTVSNVPTSLAIAASDYISQNVVCDTLMTGVETVAVPEVSLKSITGAVISLGFTYTSSVAADGEADTQNWYSDYNNVAYTIYNKTKQQNINQFNVQYPQIVLLEEVGEGDVLELTAASKTSAFMPVTATATVDAEQRARATFDIVELGKIQATFAKNGNAAVVGSLYDVNGKLLKSYDYSNASLTISNLADGKYTLVSMGSSRLFNTIYDLSQLPQTGLVSGSDYAQNTVEVKSGIVSVVNIDEVPTLDESKLYYTGDNTSFTVNKSSIVAGNYLTLTGHLDFKSTYATSVSNVNLIVDLPESCSFVENSVMVGNSISNYTLNGTRLTIPVARYTDRVRFCVIPTRGGSCNISALTSFDIAGITHTQPVGTVHSAIKDIAISAPSVINSPQILVKGYATAGSKINIYWDNVLSGTCTSNRAGNWQCQIAFESLPSFSEHSLWAQIEVSDELTLLTESKSVTFDEECPIINKVTMINTAHPSSSLNLCEYVTTFDFTNSEIPGTYWYWPSYPKFTFIANIDSGNGNKIADVTIYALTEREKWVPLKAVYDSTLNRWVATENFYSGELPVNVGVTYRYITDDISVERFIGAINNNKAEYIDENQEPVDIQTSDDGKTLVFTYNGSSDTGFYVNNVFTDKDKVSMGYTDNGVNYHLNMSITGTNSIPKGISEYRINQDISFYMSTETSGSTSKGLICYPVAMIDNMIGSSNAVGWSYTEDFNAIKQYACGAMYVLFSYEILAESVKAPSPESILDDAEDNCPELAPIIDRMRRRAEHSRRMNRDLDGFRRATGIGARVVGHAGPLGQAASRGINLGNRSVEFGQEAGNYVNSLADRNDMASLQAAGCLPTPPEPDTPNPNRNSGYVMDPSGYVYEAVAANRLEGVTATCYYKETVEDMYGDLHENIVKWDAAEYAQENPLFTDENGMYRWDVPQGLWQVKFEKDGYETTYSEWLPVPPPQLEVNIAMKQNVQPNVKNARAFEDAVEIEFDKYMIPELLTAEHITVTADGKNVEGTIMLLNEEVSHEGATETFASKVRFNAAKPFDATEVTVTVSNRVKSYAGIRMQDNFSQSFTIEPEVRKIVCDSVAVIGYGDEGILTVTVLPASAAAGKVLKVRTSSSLILAAGATSAVLDEKGRAEIRVTGELPGAAAVTFTVDGYDLSGTTVVNVKQKEEMTVATPTASIASGTTVAKGTEVTLSCATEGATIYYTLDGSCPCVDTDARKVYDGTPIVVNERVTIKAMAVAPGMYESEVAEFSYTVAVTGVEEVTVDGNIEISPLPVRDKLNVTAGGEVIRQVDVVSTNGVRVAASTRAATKITLDVSRIPTGVYIIHVATDKGSFSRKVVKVQ